MVPPIKLWDAGVPNRAALTIMTRNSRMPDSLAADLDAECSACLMGSRRIAELFDRYGRDTVEACFDAIVAGTTETYRREILTQDPDRHLDVGGLRRARRRRRAAAAHPAHHPDEGRRGRAGGPKLIVDFTGHRAAGQGADQSLRRLCRRQLPEEVAGAHPAQPRRHP